MEKKKMLVGVLGGEANMGKGKEKKTVGAHLR